MARALERIRFGHRGFIRPYFREKVPYLLAYTFNQNFGHFVGSTAPLFVLEITECCLLLSAHHNILCNIVFAT